MQRFKNLTKKSGKVASAILSAAMVTSMVLGTNVVEVKAEENTEATTDVQAVTTNNDQEAVRAAKADLEAALKGLPVNANLTLDEVDFTKDIADDGDLDTCLTQYATAIKKIEKQYTINGKKALLIGNAKISVEEPSLTKTGTLTLTYDVKRGKGSVNEDGYATALTSENETVQAKIVYTLASYSDRAAAATKAVNEALAEYKVNNTTTGGALETVVENALGDTGLTFADFDADAEVTVKDLQLATNDKKGTIEANIHVNQLKPTTDGTKSTTSLDAAPVEINNYVGTIPTNQERIDEASVAISKYLKDARYLDANIATATTAGALAPDTDPKGLNNFARFVEGTDGSTVQEDFVPSTSTNLAKGGLRAYLQQYYPDVQIEKPDDTNADAKDYTKFELIDPATQNTDGKATVSFVLETNKAAFNYTPDTKVGTAKVDNATKYDDLWKVTKKQTEDVTLLSDKTKAERAVADLSAVAADMDVTDYDTDDFNKEFKKLVNATYGVYSQDSTGNVFTFTAPSTKNTEKFDKNVYANDVADPAITVEFIGSDASAYRPGQPKVIITASFQTKNANAKTAETVSSTVTEFKEATDSAETVLAHAKADVEKALADMHVTNDTKDADVEALINQVLKDNGYADKGIVAESVVSDIVPATAEQAGTITVTAKLVDKVNGITLDVAAEKEFTYLSNTFVEKDGKKFYYDKDGNLLKNTFLQGTDSPDGYTYYIQNDGSVMQDRLTYHPNGKDVIYFDKDGHEVFDAFVNVKKDVQGNPVDYIGYFGTLGYAYINQTTYGNGEGAYSKDALFYINDYGVLENKGWFQNAAGNIGYAATNGTLTTNQWGLDQFGRKVYFQANGFLAKGLITDGAKYYQLDENDGHLVGEF